MTPSFRFLEDIALADTAFEATGETPSDLFTAAASAVIDTMVDPGTVDPLERKTITRSNDRLDALLFDWLEDIVYLKDADCLVFHDVVCEVSEARPPAPWRLRAELRGERIAPDRHTLRMDVKAVTKHRFDLRRDGSRWTATVVLDI